APLTKKRIPLAYIICSFLVICQENRPLQNVSVTRIFYKSAEVIRTPWKYVEVVATVDVAEGLTCRRASPRLRAPRRGRDFMKVLVCDPISPKGIALLQQRPEFEVVVLPKRLSEGELLPVVKDVTAMVVRSETKVTAKVIEAAPKLKVVGRAGVGIDNVDVQAATR